MKLAKTWKKDMQAALNSDTAAAWRFTANMQELNFRQNRTYAKDMQEYVPRTQWADIFWTNDCRMTRIQSSKVKDLILMGAKVWSFVQNRKNMACAAVLKMEQRWILVFESGLVTYGEVPVFPSRWSAKIKREQSQNAAENLPQLKQNANGGFSVNRYE